jgi:hypothetical protein
MSRGGKNKLTARQHKLLGTYRKDRHSKSDTAEKKLSNIISPVSDFPVPKEITSPIVAQEFCTHVELLNSIGMLCKVDYAELSLAYIYLQKVTQIKTEFLHHDPLDSDFDTIFKRFTKLQEKYSAIVSKYFVSPQARLKLTLDSLSAQEKQQNIESKPKNIIERIVSQSTN